jgi:hypothetical protein
LPLSALPTASRLVVMPCGEFAQSRVIAGVEPEPAGVAGEAEGVGDPGAVVVALSITVWTAAVPSMLASAAFNGPYRW